MTKIRKEEVNIPAIPFPGIELKRNTFNIKHYLHKTYLHKKFILAILAYIRIMTLLKKNYFEKFIEELSFVELSPWRGCYATTD